VQVLLGQFVEDPVMATLHQPKEALNGMDVPAFPMPW
jgi:hypothetical protein